MASPVHRFLFSPPASPTSMQGSHSPLLEPVESMHAMNRLFSLSGNTASGSSSTFHPGSELDCKKQTPTLAASDAREQLAGPGGFVSTQAYPSRDSSAVKGGSQQGYEMPPFPASSSSYQPRPTIAPALSRHNSFSNVVPSNVPTDFALPPPAVQRDALSIGKTWSHSARPKTVVRAVIIVVLVLGGIGFFLRSSNALLPTLRMDRIRQELVDIEKISMVGGKRVRVTGQMGAPRTLTYADSLQNQVIAPASVYRPVKSTPLTPTQELLALQSYLLANPSHSITQGVDTSRSLDPMSLVGFKATDKQGWAELRDEVEPVVVWSTGATWTTPVLELLELYSLLPGPVTLTLEARPDQSAINSVLARIVGGRSADSPSPLITIGGKPIDGYAPLLKLHTEGKLHAMLERAGAIVDGRTLRDDLERARQARLQMRVKQARIVVQEDGE